MTAFDELRFFLDRDGDVTGPRSDDDVREALRDGAIEEGTKARLAGTDVWVSPRAWATLNARRSSFDRPAPPVEATTRSALSKELAAAGFAARALLLWFVHENAKTVGPMTGEQLARARREGRHAKALVSIVDEGEWYPIDLVVARAVADEPAPESARSAPETPRAGAPPSREPASAASAAVPILATHRCAVCLEKIPIGVAVCTECGEPASAAPVSGAPSIPDAVPGASFWSLHWRPIVVLSAMLGIFCSGVMLRTLAPGLVAPAKPPKAAAAAPPPACPSACWPGEACVDARCVWMKPNDVGHVAASGDPTVGGPFALAKDVSDALPLDAERFAVALLGGVEVVSARTGEILATITEAPQARRLYRVGNVLYATAPQRIYVIDAASLKVSKTIEVGAQVGDVTVGAGGRRALASLPSAHSVAVLATEYHAEIDRIQFGDDPVGPMGVDETGTRALTTTGQIPVPGLRDPQGGAVYAFDPSRLASAQDRVRASLVGNPVSVLMMPNGDESWVALRAEDKVVPLEWLASGAVRRLDAIATCREPEQLALLRNGRRAIARCNEGRAAMVFDVTKREPIATIALNARATDMAIAPDGDQAVFALPGEGNGFVGIVDAKTYAARMVPLDAEPSRVRLSPDGKTALVLSDRSKVAWVIR